MFCWLVAQSISHSVTQQLLIQSGRSILHSVCQSVNLLSDDINDQWSFDRLVVLIIQSDGQPACLSVCLSTVRIRTQTQSDDLLTWTDSVKTWLMLNGKSVTQSTSGKECWIYTRAPANSKSNTTGLGACAPETPRRKQLMTHITPPG